MYICEKEILADFQFGGYEGKLSNFLAIWHVCMKSTEPK